MTVTCGCRVVSATGNDSGVNDSLMALKIMKPLRLIRILRVLKVAVT